MPLKSSMIGLQGTAASDHLDDRWVMNYAAAVADDNTVYYENRVSEPLPAHPAYISQLEWNAISHLHEEKLVDLTVDERIRGVHAFNATRLHRGLISDDQLSAQATVVGIEQRRAGGRMTIRIDTVDAAGKPVATSYTVNVYRGVEAEDEAPPPEIELGPRLNPLPRPVRMQEIEIGRLTPFTFSECARDYGPIHTDIKIATDAGLPGLILHGTGTIAFILSALTNHEAGGDPGRVRGFQARLTGMVMCPSVMRLRVFNRNSSGLIHYDVLTEAGDTAISDGILLLGEES